MRRPLFGSFLLAIIVGSGGCGPGYVPVTGVVKLDGTPVANAEVVFLPENGKESFFGVTNDAGQFEVFSSTGKGVLPGVYKVTVMKKPPGMASSVPGGDDYMKSMMDTTKDAAKKPGGPPTMGKGGPMMPGGMAPPGSTVNKPPDIKTDLPKIYALGNTTPIKVTVPHDGPVAIDLKAEEKKDPKEKKK